MTQSLVVPSNIPWQALKKEQLEECLYWLLDALGAKDLEWRKGGKGGGAADQGRDLEAVFHVPQPDGEVQPQKWWIESKGRKGTVEPSAVKEAVVNTQSRKDIDLLVVATNTQFSNQTREWVKEWQSNNPRPIVRLWDRDSLERMFVKHPAVVVRLFPEALSAEGRIEAIRSRFWNQCYLPSEAELDRSWNERSKTEISPEAAIALVAGEIANGRLSLRPWLMTLSDDDLRRALAIGITNAFYILPRADQLGTNTEPIEGSLANALMTAFARFGFDEVWAYLEELWSLVEGEVPPRSFQQAALKCAIHRMVSELADVCAYDCKRVSHDSGIVDDDERFHYWDRFKLPDEESYKRNRRNRTGVLVIEKDDAPCEVGLHVDKSHRCPLISYERDDDVNREMLKTFHTIVTQRIAKAKK